MQSRLLFFLIALLGLFTTTAHAQTTYRILAGQSLPVALSIAAAGDITYVDGGTYGDVTISKKVTLIGNGYFGSGTSASPAEAIVGTLQVRPGAEGSVITGMVIGGDCRIGASNVIVARNRVIANLSIGYDGADLNYVTANNVVFSQNYVEGMVVAQILTTGTSVAHNFSVRNNIVIRGFISEGRVSGEFINNTFGSAPAAGSTYSAAGVGNSDCKLQSGVRFKNNITTQIFNGATNQCALYDNPGFIPPVFANNVIRYFTWPGNTTPTDPQFDELFVGWPTVSATMSTDARTQLKAGSVALTAGEGGTQAGAFGGDDPYVLGGVPFIPTITQLTVPAVVPQNETMTVTVKAQSNN